MESAAGFSQCHLMHLLEPNIAGSFRADIDHWGGLTKRSSSLKIYCLVKGGGEPSSCCAAVAHDMHS